MTRIAGLIVAALMLLLPAAAQADHPSAAAEEGVLGRAHMLEHAKIWKAQARARTRWAKMSPRERRALRRMQRRATRRAYVRARSAASTPADEGSWAPPFVMTSNYQGYAIHAAMLRTGKVLMWGYPIHVEQQDAWRGNESYAWLWDPSKGYGSDSVEDVTPVINGENVSIYCSGMSFLPDGRVLVVGGTLSWGVDDPNDEFVEFAGLDTALLFDPATETWDDLPRPTGSHGRWYPTQTLLPDGRTFVISGLSDVAPGGVLNDTHELYSADGQSVVQLDSAAQRRTTELYPHLFTMPDGKLLLAGPDRTDSARFDPANLANPWTNLPQTAQQRIGGTAVLLPEDHNGSTEVALIGGRPYDGLPPALNEMIDLDDASPSWGTFPGLSTPRSYPNTVLLPDGSMVTVGGDDRVGNWPPPERAVELYDPVTGSWRAGPSQVETRAYHSTALLLPDGRVLSTGDDFNPTSTGDRADSSPDDTGEIYSPPYLFQGSRPAISSAPAALRWNVPFGVGTADDVDKAVLIAPSAVTHANDMNQRLVPLRIVDEYPSQGLTLQSPPSANVAPPGYYMLFLLKNGVPSVAEWVRLDSSAADVPVYPPGGEPDTTAPDTTLTAGPSGTATSSSASFEFSSTETGSTFQCKLDTGAWTACSSPKAYTSLADGSHTFSVKAKDAAGNEDATPASRTWNVDATVPDTEITSKPDAATTATSASFGFSSTESGSTFQCNLDTGVWQSCVSPQAYSALSDGSHTFRVRATDAAGNPDPTEASWTWTVDTTPPDTTIGGGPNAPTTATSASFSFSSSEWSAAFECKLDAAASWSPCSSPQEYSGLGDGSHTFEVRAKDALGNADPSPASRTWTVDTTPPGTDITGGPSGIVASSSASFEFSSGDTGASFECRLDAEAWSACVSPKAYSSLPDGPHTFQVRAKDALGNTDASPASQSWTVDLTAPAASISSGPSGTVAATTAIFEFFSADEDASFECALDSDTWQPCGSPMQYTALADGPHTFRVRAKDQAGNVHGEPRSRTWIVDTAAPDTSLTAGPSGTVAASSASFEFSSGDGSASFECKLDSGAWAGCTSPTAGTGLTDGPHTFWVRAKDPAGNADPTPASRTWVVDTTPPDTAITSGPVGTVASNSAAFGFSSTDGDGSFECRLDTGDWAPCSDPATYSGLAQGGHTFSVRAKDAVGNVDPAPAERSWSVDTTPDDSAPPPDPEPDPGGDPNIEEDEPAAEEPDFDGPALRLDFAERRWLRELRRTGGLRVRVEVDEPARVLLKLFRNSSRVARRHVSLDGGSRKVTLRLRRSAHRWIRGASAPRLWFEVRAVDAARNDTTWTRLLSRPALRR